MFSALPPFPRDTAQRLALRAATLLDHPKHQSPAAWRSARDASTASLSYSRNEADMQIK